MLLEWLRLLRGSLPLVLVTDNGSVYASKDVRLYLDAHQVVHLFNRPHTPQHNPWGERANGVLKAESELGKGVRLSGPDAALPQLSPALHKHNHVRPLRSRGWRTPAQADAEAVHWSARDREAFYLAALCAKRKLWWAAQTSACCARPCARLSSIPWRCLD